MIPDEAVEAAHEQLDAMGAYVSPKYVRAALEEAAPHIFAHLLAFADERDNALGSIRSHITTCELRKLLGVEDG